MIVAISKASLFFGGRAIFNKIGFQINPGDRIGLVGRNGAGKSTLIKILSGAHQQDTGDLFFENNKVFFKSTKDAMKLGIETIYQYSALIPQMSISRNIFIGRESTNMNIGNIGIMKKKEMEEAAVKALNDVGLKLRSPNTPVNLLSGGERQGVVIARAMYFKSKFLILDEPTNHLSIKETNKVLDFVAGLKDQGVTSIFITHNLNHVFPIADHLCVMARGEKIADLQKDKTDIQELTNLLVNG